MRVWREQPHHGHRVDGLASGTSLAVGEQLRALRDGGEWLGHGRQSHKSNDARMRFHDEAQNRQTGFNPSRASTASLSWLCWDPTIRHSVHSEAHLCWKICVRICKKQWTAYS